MNIFKKIYCRSFQTVFKIALPFLPYRKPKIVSALSDIPSVLNKKKKSCPIIITDPELQSLAFFLCLQMYSTIPALNTMFTIKL